MTTSRHPSRVLLVDDEPNLRKVLGALLHQCGYEVHAEPDGHRALAHLKNTPRGTFDAVVSDLRMPGMSGMQLLKEILLEDPNLPVIILTAHGSVDTAVEAVKLGAFDFLEKPFERSQIEQVVGNAVATRSRRGPSVFEIPRTPSPEASNSVDEQQSPADSSSQIGMVGQSPAMEKVYEIINTVAASPSTVLITGESGTGKELVARALHHGSPRRDRPFIRINCAAIPASLVESELFGHEKGAFTGAISSRAGRFELADGGTLFLDEVGEIPLEIQVKLLRAIQESEFERVGGVKTMQVDVRIVAATNRSLEDSIKEKSFREDLYYRLNVVPVSIPPLRERKEDLDPLLQHFVERSNERLGKSVKGFDTEAHRLLHRYSWPGNVRELENLVERMVLFAAGEWIAAYELPDSFQFDIGEGALEERKAESPDFPGGEKDASGSHIRLPLSSLGLDLKGAVRAGSRLVEEALIREALKQTDANVTHSARLLGISRRSLQSKMKELGLRESEEP